MLKPPDTDAPTDGCIREHLEHVLSSPQFKNSNRCSSFLRYAVEETLTGQIENLKERTIGVAVFRRDPNYDTNQDAVVRNAAIEVRKRLAQYYQDTDTGASVRIELPAGAYVPQFLPWQSASERSAPDAVPIPEQGERRRGWLLASAGALLLFSYAGWWAWERSQHIDLDRFWAPLVDGGETVQVCVGQPARLFGFSFVPDEKTLRGIETDDKALISLKQIRHVEKSYLFQGDAFAMSKVAAYLQSRAKPYRLRSGAVIPYSDLRGSPVVLIGAHNNAWTIRLTFGLRFWFEGFAVRDRQNPGKPVGVATDASPSGDHEDFVIITRMLEPTTERTIVSAAGVGHKGTLAAGEFITNPAYMREAVRGAPKDWYRKNAQFVVQVKIVGGTPGPPQVVATHFW